MTQTGPLVSAEWLKDHIDDPDVVVIDATFHLPAANRDAKAEYLEAHIPGARFFDVNGVCDPTSDLPHMMPSAAIFAAAISAMGIGNATTVICYDTYGLFSAARPWWMFRAFGHEKVAILDGGLPAWKAVGGALQSGEVNVEPAVFKAKETPDFFKTWKDVFSHLENDDAQILDARSNDRFHARAPEPRPGLRGGHIPGSINLPFTLLVDQETGKVKPAEEIASLFAQAGIDPTFPTVCSCGSGVSACALVLGLYLVGDRTASVYDGSWSEWGGREDLPVAT